MRLELKTFLLAFRSYSNFNSIKVRLENIDADTAKVAKKFQFHKGAIGVGINTTTDAGYLYFNSIKVRLEMQG